MKSLSLGQLQDIPITCKFDIYFSNTAAEPLVQCQHNMNSLTPNNAILWNPTKYFLSDSE